MSIWQAFMFALDDADPLTLLVLCGFVWIALLAVLGGLGSWVGHLLSKLWPPPETVLDRKRKAWR